MGATMDLQYYIKEANDIAREKGFYDEQRTYTDVTALFHSEVSEFFEAYRAGDPPDKHCPQYPSTEVELADLCIRIFDSAAYYNWQTLCIKMWAPAAIYTQAQLATNLHNLISKAWENANFTEEMLSYCLSYIIKWFGSNSENTLEEVIQTKMEYNKTRPYKHGKKC